MTPRQSCSTRAPTWPPLARDVTELQRALATSRQIGMAMGILMERHRLTPEQAFDRLRDLSQRRNVKLRDLADQVVYTGDTEQRHD